MSKLKQVRTFRHQIYNISACSNITLTKHFFVQDQPTEIMIFDIQETLQMLFVTSYSLISCSVTHNHSGRQKHEDATAHLQITHTLILSTADETNVRLSHDQKEVCAVSKICFFVFSNFGLYVSDVNYYNKITKTEVCRFRRGKNPELCHSNKEVNMKWPDWLTFRTENSSPGALWIPFGVH